MIEILGVLIGFAIINRFVGLFVYKDLWENEMKQEIHNELNNLF